MRREEEARWEDEGGATLPRRAWVVQRDYFDRMYESILHMDFSLIEKRMMAWFGSPPYLHHTGGVVTGRWKGRVGDYERYQMPGLRPNETPAILKAADDRIERYPARIKTTDIVINVHGSVDPDLYREAAAKIREQISADIERRAFFHPAHGAPFGGTMRDYQRQSLAAMEDYCRGDEEATRKLNDAVFPAKRSLWDRIRAWWPW